jgi:hypothetical protein
MPPRPKDTSCSPPLSPPAVSQTNLKRFFPHRKSPSVAGSSVKDSANDPDKKIAKVRLRFGGPSEIFEKVERLEELKDEDYVEPHFQSLFAPHSNLQPIFESISAFSVASLTDRTFFERLSRRIVSRVLCREIREDRKVDLGGLANDPRFLNSLLTVIGGIASGCDKVVEEMSFDVALVIEIVIRNEPLVN